MQRILLTLFALVLSVGIGIPEAEAKRLGGGKSTGMQRESMSQPGTTPSAAPMQNPTGSATGPAARKNSWLGPVAGLAAGLGLAALASHLGMGEELASILLIALLAIGALALFRLFMRKRPSAPAMQYAALGAGGDMAPVGGSRPLMMSAAPVAATPKAFPPGFDSEGFVRQAKLNFLRLQAANDSANLDDLREFTSPEMFAEIQLQLSERGHAAQHTEVVAVDAEILSYAEEPQRHVLSVRFHGQIREEPEASPTDFNELWHLTKPVVGSSGWVVAGIQQAQ